MSFIGVKLRGFCNGFFGRDSYEDKLVIYEGNKFIIALYDDGTAAVANFCDEATKTKFLTEWIAESEIGETGDS